jgi:hypothetical protein
LERHWEVVEPGRPNVIGILNGPEGGKRLMFEGHTDVVTEGDASAWKHPFEARSKPASMGAAGAIWKAGWWLPSSPSGHVKSESLGGSILIGARWMRKGG